MENERSSSAGLVLYVGAGPQDLVHRPLSSCLEGEQWPNGVLVPQVEDPLAKPPRRPVMLVLEPKGTFPFLLQLWDLMLATDFAEIMCLFCLFCFVLALQRSKNNEDFKSSKHRYFCFLKYFWV